MTAIQRLDTVCEFNMGQAPDGESYNNKGDGVPLIAGAGDFSDCLPKAKKFTTKPGKLCKAGDIILGIRATIGEKVVADREYCLGRGVVGLRPRPGLHGRYLWHWLEHIAPALASKARGATFKQVNREDIGELAMALPPLPEQQRIADVLDRAEALRAKRREALAQLESLTQSIFLDMFGDPARNPKGWQVVQVGDVADVQGGLQVTSARNAYPRKIPYLRVANVYRGFLDLSEIKTLRATDAEITRTILLKDDLLVVEGHGNPQEIGRGALWDGSISLCVHQNHIIRVRFDRGKIVAGYACEYLNSSWGRLHLLRSGKTTSGLNTICVSDVRAAPIALPSLSLQLDFARRIAAVAKLKVAHRASQGKQDELFAALQHCAFRGELWQ